MSISLRTHKMLWGRAANRCAMPDCRIPLVVANDPEELGSVIGEECHITAKNRLGPRGTQSIAAELIDSYPNLILMCRNHHKEIDDNPDYYTTHLLSKLKTDHEEWVRSSLEGFDLRRQHDEETYAAVVEEWSSRVHLSEWTQWTSRICHAGRPELGADIDDDLERTRDWLFTRVWPGRYQQLECAFNNFRCVLQDFHIVFHRHACRIESIYRTDEFFRIDDWNPEKYQRLYQSYWFHVDLVEDLLLELTRAANLVCDEIRESIDLSYRINEGVLVVESGPYYMFEWRSHRPEYREADRKTMPYPGLSAFKSIRSTRDIAFGVGTSPLDPVFIDRLSKSLTSEPQPYYIE